MSVWLEGVLAETKHTDENCAWDWKIILGEEKTQTTIKEHMFSVPTGRLLCVLISIPSVRGIHHSNNHKGHPQLHLIGLLWFWQLLDIDPAL